MNFITVTGGLLNLDQIVYIHKDDCKIALSNGQWLSVTKDEIANIYDAMVKYILKERVKELQTAQEDSDGS